MRQLSILACIADDNTRYFLLRTDEQNIGSWITTMAIAKGDVDLAAS